MRVAMVGTRGVPARYGGFETCVEEVGRRLVDAGHEVVVYCRPPEGEKASDQPDEYLGMELVHLPAVRHRVLETLSHTAVSMLHPSISDVDCAIVFNAGNAPLIPVLRAHGIPVATHVDGLEWRRSKWSKVGRRYYRAVEALAVRWSDALTELIAYGAPILAEPGSDRIAALGLEPKGYHLVVARFEPENHVLEAVRGYVASNAKLPLVVVGSSPYGMEYTAEIEAAASSDVRLLGAVWDQTELDQLYANALSYVHGHSVGGTNPSLLRAAGAGAYVIAYDCIFNREVLNGDGDYFRTPEDLAVLLEATEREPQEALALGSFARESIRRYDWDDVAARYEELCTRLVTEGPTKRRPSGRRVGTWVESALGTDAAGPAGTALPPQGERPGDLDVHDRANARV
jgi:glycosyltransferase involved in cell wall biosynthesis